MEKEILKNIAKALGIETDYSIPYYGEYGLSREEAEEYACRRLGDAIYDRVEELVHKIEKLEKIISNVMGD